MAGKSALVFFPTRLTDRGGNRWLVVRTRGRVNGNRYRWRIFHRNTSGSRRAGERGRIAQIPNQGTATDDGDEYKQSNQQSETGFHGFS